MLVQEIMRTTVYTVRPDDTCEFAAQFMANKLIGSLIVVDDEDGVLGIVTETDMVRKLVAKGKDTNTLVREIMTQDIVVIGPEFTIEEAADVMIQNKIKKLPVVENDKMVGIITTTDIAHNEEKLIDVLATTFLKKKAGYMEDVPQGKAEDLPTN